MKTRLLFLKTKNSLNIFTLLRKIINCDTRNTQHVTRSLPAGTTIYQPVQKNGPASMQGSFLFLPETIAPKEKISSMKTFLRRSKFLVIAFVIANLFSISAALGQATVTTDRLDYPPGDTAIITGTGFQPGETVTLQVLHAVGDSLGTDPQYHQPFTAIADSVGNIYATWWVPNNGDALGALFKLTADGQTSLLHAEALFTDGAAADGNGTMTVAPTSVCANSTGNSFTFTFKAGS